MKRRFDAATKALKSKFATPAEKGTAALVDLDARPVLRKLVGLGFKAFLGKDVDELIEICRNEKLVPEATKFTLVEQLMVYKDQPLTYTTMQKELLKEQFNQGTDQSFDTDSEDDDVGQPMPRAKKSHKCRNPPGR